jgi:branched-chain amino acid transport system ATP-binding protein
LPERPGANRVGRPAADHGVGVSEFVLEALGLVKRFGGVTALENYELRLARDDLVGLIGPNGAGKTTAFNLLSGVLAPTAGSILIDGRDITSLSTHRRARLGIARTFQNVRLFQDLTVLENVMVGAHHRLGSGLAASLLGLPGSLRAEGEIREAARGALAAVGLEAAAGERAGDLAYGRQRMVEIARALATAPRILLLDEPAAGMNPNETGALVSMIARLHRERRLAIVVVEHDMRLVARLCHRVQAINKGELLAAGTADEVLRDPAVIEAYLGAGWTAADA